MLYQSFFLIFLVGAAGVLGSHHFRAAKSGTCLEPSTNSSAEDFEENIIGHKECLYQPFDVSEITMTMSSPDDSSTREEITTVEQFKAKGCCGKPTLFTHHGWRESGNVTWNPELQTVFGTATQGCSIAFDYSQASAENYICTVYRNVNNIGKECARKVYTTFVDTGCLDPKDITYMGFSMGSPIAIRNAYAMLNTYKTTVQTVYCMDPAGPLFDTAIKPPESSYYNAVAKSGTQLQCIHTSIILGTTNYGLCPSSIITGNCLRSQSECNKSLLIPICSHKMAPSILISSYKYPGSIVAKKCSVCPWHLGGILPICQAKNTDTEVAGYQTRFKEGKFWYYSPKTCIDVYS